MADRRFLNAFLTPSRTTILGFVLPPFCLKHRIWLDGIESPFVQENKEITPTDLIIALKLCAGQSLDAPTWKDKWIGFRLTMNKKMFENACCAFVSYIETSPNWPRFFEKKDKKSFGSSGIPWQLSILASLVKHGVQYQEALEMPEAKAIWLSAMFSIQDGAKIELLTTDDEALIDSLAKMEAQKNVKHS